MKPPKIPIDVKARMLRAAAGAQGDDIAAVAKKMDVTPPYIFQWMSGKKKLSWEVEQKLVVYINTGMRIVKDQRYLDPILEPKKARNRLPKDVTPFDIENYPLPSVGTRLKKRKPVEFILPANPKPGYATTRPKENDAK